MQWPSLALFNILNINIKKKTQLKDQSLWGWCDVHCNCPQLLYCTIDTLRHFRDVVSIIPCLLICHYYLLYFHESSLTSYVLFICLFD